MHFLGKYTFWEINAFNTNYLTSYWSINDINYTSKIILPQFSCVFFLFYTIKKCYWVRFCICNLIQMKYSLNHICGDSTVAYTKLCLLCLMDDFKYFNDNLNFTYFFSTPTNFNHNCLVRYNSTASWNIYFITILFMAVTFSSKKFWGRVYFLAITLHQINLIIFNPIFP